MKNIVTALNARRNLGEFLNKAFYNGEETFVERKGRVIAKIVPISSRKKAQKNILDYAGIWKNKADVIMMKKTVKEGRVQSASYDLSS